MCILTKCMKLYRQKEKMLCVKNSVCKMNATGLSSIDTNYDWIELPSLNNSGLERQDNMQRRLAKTVIWQRLKEDKL